jgi:hypothetical protein
VSSSRSKFYTQDNQEASAAARPDTNCHTMEQLFCHVLLAQPTRLLSSSVVKPEQIYTQDSEEASAAARPDTTCRTMEQLTLSDRQPQANISTLRQA